MAAISPNSTERTIEVFRRSSNRASMPSDAAITTEKLRDSCQACAASKVKCNKEKPTCFRCKRRGTACHYFATKRPGRKRISAQPRPSPGQHPASLEARPVIIDWSKEYSMLDNVGQGQLDSGSLPNATQQWCSEAPGSDSAISIDVALSPTSNIFDPGLLSAWDPVLETSGSDIALGDLTGNLTNHTDLPDSLSAVGAQGFTSSATDTNDFFSVFARNSETSSRSEPSSAPFGPGQARDISLGGSAQPPRRPSTDQEPPFATSPFRPHELSSDTSLPDSCLSRALRLVRDLTIKKQTACAKARSETIPHLQAQAVVVENKRAIEAVQAVLECSCSASDGVVLIILGLAVMEVLDTYTSAAQTQGQQEDAKQWMPCNSPSLVRSNTASGTMPSPPPSASPSSLRSRSWSFESQFSLNAPISPAITKYPASTEMVKSQRLDRLGVNIILGELHRVQRVVKEIAVRLERYHSLRDERPRGGTVGEVGVTEAGYETHPPMFFSAATCNDMAQDLRGRVGVLAKGLIEILRKV